MLLMVVDDLQRPIRTKRVTLLLRDPYAREVDPAEPDPGLRRNYCFFTIPTVCGPVVLVTVYNGPLGGGPGGTW